MLGKFKTLDCVSASYDFFSALFGRLCKHTISPAGLVTSGVGKSSLSLIKEELETGGDPLVVIWVNWSTKGEMTQVIATVLIMRYRLRCKP